MSTILFRTIVVIKVESHIIFLNFLIVLPIYVWLIRVKDIYNVYSIFGYSLLVGFIAEVIQQITTNNEISKSISFCYYLIETQLLLYIYLQWTNIKKQHWVYFHAVFLGLFLLSFYFGYLREEMYFYTGYMIALVILVFLGIRILTNVHLNTTLSQKLIIIPFLVYAIYYILLNILMKYLYSKSTQALFIRLYDTIAVINMLSYISYSFAFKWAPKKERYL